MKVERESNTCHVCGAVSEFDVASQAEESGSPDLDTRPAGPLRETLRYWVQECPSCGYCAPMIGTGPAIAARVVRTAAYQDLLHGEAVPRLARRFQCASAILEYARQLGDAGWQAVYAAWACDDEKSLEAAIESRLRAVELFLMAQDAGGTVSEIPGEDAAVVTDLLRRAGKFDETVSYGSEALTDASDGVRQLLTFSVARAAAHDDRKYTVADAKRAAPADA